MANTCHSCGLCCKLFLINLSQEEFKLGKYQTMFEGHNIPTKYGANLLAQKPDGSCIYLVNDKCSIHNDRPKVCRAFFCTTKSKKFTRMVEIITTHRSAQR